MKRIYCLLLGLLFSHCSFGQFSLSELGCKTVTNAEEMQEVARYIAGRPLLKTTTAADTIPLSIHIVGDDNGQGYYNLNYLFTVLCQLNERYAPAGLYYYVQWPIDYIDNSSYYAHNYQSGFQMMSGHNVPNTANVYFVEDPSGACGYFSWGGDAVAIKISCALPNSTTLTHELGHYFGLPHTFNGWENGNIPSNPEKVTRTTGANCSSTGDLFCDTDADYLSDRWNCPYTGNKTDQNGDSYHPDSSLYMSYSSDVCMSRFSDLQIGRMQDNLYNERPDLLLPTKPVLAPIDTVSFIYPSDTVYANNKTISWNKVTGAEYYYVTISLQNITLIKQEAFTADTTIPVSFNIYPNVPYKVTVAPVNAYNFCRLNKRSRSFSYSANAQPLDIEDQVSLASQIYPNPANDYIVITFSRPSSQPSTVQMSDINGRTVYETKSKAEHVTIPTAGLADGLYLIRLVSAGRSSIQKLYIRH